MGHRHDVKPVLFPIALAGTEFSILWAHAFSWHPVARVKPPKMEGRPGVGKHVPLGSRTTMWERPLLAQSGHTPKGVTSESAMRRLMQRSDYVLYSITCRRAAQQEPSGLGGFEIND
jgi:hypothetical protein